MSNFKFQLDEQGVKQNILQADWMLNYAEQVAQSQCDADSHVKAFVGTQRVHAIVYPNTKEHS